MTPAFLQGNRQKQGPATRVLSPTPTEPSQQVGTPTLSQSRLYLKELKAGGNRNLEPIALSLPPVQALETHAFPPSALPGATIAWVSRALSVRPPRQMRTQAART